MNSLSHSDPSHPRYCSPARFAELKRLRVPDRPTTLPCKEVEFNKLGQATGVRFHTGAIAHVAYSPYRVVPTRRRELKNWITTGARIERAHRA